MAQPGSAPAWHAGGQGFESPWIHNRALNKTIDMGKEPFIAKSINQPVAFDGLIFVFVDGLN